MPSAFHGNRRAYSGSNPFLQYSAKPPGGFSCEIPGAPGGMRRSVPLPHGTPMVWNYLTMRIGYVRYAGGFDAVMEPYRRPLVERPSAEHQEAVQLDVYVSGHELVTWTITSQIVMNRVKLLHEQFENYAEASRGMLPVMEYVGDDPVTLAKWQGETFYCPNMSIRDWMDYDSGVFGPPTVRPPVPILAESVPPVALPASPAVDLPWASPAANDAPAPYRPVPQAAPAAAPSAATTAPAANDLLAKYARRNS